MIPLSAALSIPEPVPSLAEPLTVIELVVFAFAAGVLIASCGPVVSSITFAITLDVVFPALSVAVAVTDTVPSSSSEIISFVYFPFTRLQGTGALSPTVSVTVAIPEAPPSVTVSSTGHDDASA